MLTPVTRIIGAQSSFKFTSLMLYKTTRSLLPHRHRASRARVRYLTYDRSVSTCMSRMR